MLIPVVIRRCFGLVGVLKVFMKMLMFLLPPESSLTVMLVMAETPWGFSSLKCFLFITVNKLGSPDNSFTVDKSPVRAGCDRAAIQAV